MENLTYHTFLPCRGNKPAQPGRPPGGLAIFGFLVTPAGSKIAQDVASLARWSHEPADRVNAVLEQLCGPDYGWTLRKISVPSEPDRFEIFHDVLGKAILAHITRFETEQELHQLERKRRRFLTGCLAVSVVLATIFALGSYLIYQNNRKIYQNNRKLEQTNITLKKAQDDLKNEQYKVAEISVLATGGTTAPSRSQS